MPYSFAERRSAIKVLQAKNKTCHNSRHHYRVDRIWTDNYFSESRLYEWQAAVKTFAAHIQSLGEPALHLDVCGNTVATRLGFDHSFQVSMSHDGSIINKGATAYRADIFARPGLKPILNEIVENHGLLALTTFQPVAGLQLYMTIGRSDTYRDFVYRRLYQQLELVVNTTRVGGYIHLERPFQMDESIGEFIMKTPIRKRLSHVTLKAWARKLRCTVRLHYDPFGPKWLLRKDYKCLGPIP